jgi:integrase
MSDPTASPAVSGREWPWPLDPGRYDRRPDLSAGEREVLSRLDMRALRRPCYDPTRQQWELVRRLLMPIDDARRAVWCPQENGQQRRAIGDAAGVILLRCAGLDRAWWGWSCEDWVDLIGTNAREFKRPWPGNLSGAARPYVAAFAYLLGGFTAFDRLGYFNRAAVARRVFGPTLLDQALAGVLGMLRGWGYHTENTPDTQWPSTLCQLLLLNRSPLLADLTTEAFERLREDPGLRADRRSSLPGIQRAVAALGHCRPPAERYARTKAEVLGGVPALWASAVERWHATSTLSPDVRRAHRAVLGKVGRWLAAEHPGTAAPEAWTRATCAAWVAAVERMRVGDYTVRPVGDRLGRPFTAAGKAGSLTALRAFFHDLHEWEWIPRRFDPNRALGTPPGTTALIGPNPRVIADEVWAKLLWAGMNLSSEDLPTIGHGGAYPIEMLRAVTMTWLFAGQRSDEIARLRVGCVRWQPPAQGGDPDSSEAGEVCLLDVPTHKTGTAFTKPVDALLGRAIGAWQAVRPEQPAVVDRKTGNLVHFLFAYRARRMSSTYINNTVIPTLCRKAGIPPEDVRGKITSHRARSTIATQLYNAKEPMSLFELQAWLGHRSPHSTQHYAAITPLTLTRAYRDAGYFQRNLRTIEVLIDRDAIATGAAATGEPWQYYDLGHGWCTYTFFEQCPHRMACARCDFYTPKDSSKGQLLEAKDNLQRMLTAIPLTEEERAAVEDGQAALDALLERLAELPTPAGPTPRALSTPDPARLLPLIEIAPHQHQTAAEPQGPPRPPTHSQEARMLAVKAPKVVDTGTSLIV